MMKTILVAFLVFCFAAASGQPGEPLILKLYQLNAEIYSVQEIEAAVKIDNHGSGMLSAPYENGGGSQLGFSARDAGGVVFVHIVGKSVNSRFLVDVTLEPDKDAVTTARKEELDLTDLSATTLVLFDEPAKNRRVLLKLIPAIHVIDLTPHPARETEWNFGASPIILDDERYAGLMGASGSDLAWIDFPGIGRAKFALKPFKGAEQAGRLYQNVLNIWSEGFPRVDIYSVSNSSRRMTENEGPYTVWVCWTESPTNLEEEVAAALKQYEELRAARERGEEFQGMNTTGLTDEMIDKAIHKLEMGQVLSYGVRGLTREELNP